jgi:peptidoglycan/xylan/chitin deacetylase (PgdA/CDA1 family)
MNITYSFYPEGRKKALTMSYDDGQIYDRRLVEIFNTYGIKGTFHLNAGVLDQDPFVSSREVFALYSGHEVSAHSFTHPYLTMMPDEMIAYEILEDRRKLEELTGCLVRGMSYPFGAYSERLLRLLPGLGIEYSRIVQSHGGFHIPDDFLTWHPTCHHDDDLIRRCKEFQNPPPWLQMPLFYVWGHSFEFERNHNWDLIEEFCKTVSGDDSVWYATNIEIMDYIQAMKALRFSVDRKMVQNPAAIPVWIGVDGEAVKIAPGQCVFLG